MPMYDYKCSHCGHTFREKLPMADRNIPIEKPCVECNQSDTISQLMGFSGIADPIKLGRVKPAAGFNEVLRNIKKGNRGSTINIRD